MYIYTNFFIQKNDENFGNAEYGNTITSNFVKSKNKYKIVKIKQLKICRSNIFINNINQKKIN